MTKRDDLLNELKIQIAQKCMVCKYGRATMKCPKKTCHNKQVRANLKKIEQLQNNRRVLTKCIVGKTDSEKC